MDQETVWNPISEPWQKFRQKPPFEVEKFIEKQNGKILDLGCGTGRNLFNNKKLTYYCVDFSIRMLGLCENYVNDKKIKALLFKANCWNLPFKENYFDSCIFISTLHCIKGKRNQLNTLKEIYRVLKPGANVMISTWAYENNKRIGKINKEGYLDWKSQGKVYSRYVYFYEKEELKKILTDIGFKIINFDEKELPGSKHSRKNIIIYCQK